MKLSQLTHVGWAKCLRKTLHLLEGPFTNQKPIIMSLCFFSLLKLIKISKMIKNSKHYLWKIAILSKS